MSEYKLPDFKQPVDFAESLAKLPAKAAVKGMFFDYLGNVARSRGVDAAVAKRSGVASRRYTAFMEYPAVDYMQVIHALGAELFPNEPAKEGLRRIGQGIYPFFVTTMIGKVLFGVLGKNPDRVLPMGPKGWQVTTNFGAVSGEMIGPKNARYHFSGMPLFLDSYTYGVIEGAYTAIDATGEVRVAVKDRESCTYDLAWR